MTKKKIIIIITAAILTAFLIAHFGFHKDIWNYFNKNLNQKKSELSCYFKSDDSKVRLIKIEKIDIPSMNKILIKGNDKFKTKDFVEEYSFAGMLKDKDFIDVFGEKKGIQEEKVYRILDKGIIEGYIAKDNKILKEIDGVEFLGVVRNDKIEFNLDYLIPKVDCKTIVE